MAQQFDIPWLMTEGRQHWRRHLPKLYARLKNNGLLESSLRQAAQQTQTLMKQYEQAGYTPTEAWPEARGEYLILNPAEYNTPSSSPSPTET